MSNFNVNSPNNNPINNNLLNDIPNNEIPPEFMPESDFDEQINRRGLLNFIAPNLANQDVLIIESTSYLREIRHLLPNANILVMSKSKDIKSNFDDLNLDWIFADFNTFKFNDENIFDLIIAEDALTFAYEPYFQTYALNRLLKPTGYLVTQFLNVRFIGILESLKQGYFAFREQHLFAKTEVVRLLCDALFKDIAFVKGDSFNFDTSDWLNFGFDNFNDDLNVKSWIVRADKSTPEVANLKSFFTPQIRSQLATLLHRIDFDIDSNLNLQRLNNLRLQHHIFDDYLADFINQAVVHKDKLYNLLNL